VAVGVSFFFPEAIQVVALRGPFQEIYSANMNSPLVMQKVMEYCYQLHTG
jgi:hypothetical protein